MQVDHRDVVIRINGQMQNSSVSSCHVAKWTHHSSSLDSSWNILSKNMLSWVINTHIYKKQNQVQEAPPFRSLPTSCPCSMASQTFPGIATCHPSFAHLPCKPNQLNPNQLFIALSYLVLFQVFHNHLSFSCQDIPVIFLVLVLLVLLLLVVVVVVVVVLSRVCC